MVKTVSTYINGRRTALRDWIRVYDEIQGPPASRMAVVLELGRRDLMEEALRLVSKKGWSLDKQYVVAMHFHEMAAGLSYQALVTMTLKMVDEHLEQAADAYDLLTAELSKQETEQMKTHEPNVKILSKLVGALLELPLPPRGHRFTSFARGRKP